MEINTQNKLELKKDLNYSHELKLLKFAYEYLLFLCNVLLLIYGKYQDIFS